MLKLTTHPGYVPVHMITSKFFAITATLFLSLATGCTWVKLTEQGEKVYVVKANEVDNCKRLGTTEASGKDRVGFMERNEAKVAKELETLARNSAARTGGDTIVADGPVEEGRQIFIIYDCPR